MKKVSTLPGQMPQQFWGWHEVAQWGSTTGWHNGVANGVPKNAPLVAGVVGIRWCVRVEPAALAVFMGGVL